MAVLCTQHHLSNCPPQKVCKDNPPTKSWKPPPQPYWRECSQRQTDHGLGEFSSIRWLQQLLGLGRMSLDFSTFIELNNPLCRGKVLHSVLGKLGPAYKQDQREREREREQHWNNFGFSNRVSEQHNVTVFKETIHYNIQVKMVVFTCVGPMCMNINSHEDDISLPGWYKMLYFHLTQINSSIRKT